VLSRTIAKDNGLVSKYNNFNTSGKGNIKKGQQHTSRVVEGCELKTMSEDKLSSVLDTKEMDLSISILVQRRNYKL
jgi:hypothetical protein